MSLIGPAKIFTRYLFLCQTLDWELETQREEGETSPALSKSPVTFTNNLGEIAETPNRHRSLTGIEEASGQVTYMRVL